MLLWAEWKRPMSETPYRGTDHRGLNDAQASQYSCLSRTHGILDATFLYGADEICGPGSQRREETAPAERQDPSVEADAGGVSAGQSSAEGDHRKTTGKA